MNEQKTAAIVTNNLICETNTKYYATLEKYLLTNGWLVSTDFHQVDKVIFATCGFSDGMLEVIKRALCDLKQINFPDEKIIMMGCLLKTHELELREVFHGPVIEFGNEDRLDQFFNAKVPFQEINLTNVFKAPSDDPEQTDNNELFNIQIADGCLKQCTYCVINKAHGDIRSVPLAEIEEQFRTAIQYGFRNINLVAVDILSYGYDIGSNIIELIEYLLKIEPNVKFYMGSLHIRWLAQYWEGLLSLCKKGIVNSLHIGLQHVNDGLLQRMGRGVKFAELYQNLCRMKDECPDLFISTDIIVGFPGETAEMFDELVNVFKADHCFELVNHYIYSDVQGAPSYHFSGKISESLKQSRWYIFKDVIGDRSPEIAMMKTNSTKFKRYKAVFQKQRVKGPEAKGYYFCMNSYAQI